MKRLVQAVLKPVGLSLTRLKTQPFGLDVLFSFLKRKGFSPRHIIDVGANHGHWTRKAIEYFPDAFYTLVEPQDRLKQDVQDLIDAGRIRWISAGADDEPGHLSFTVSHRDDSSAFLPDPTANQSTGLPPMLVEIKTLDQIVDCSGTPIPELVKIDAVGFDLKVLAGAQTLFGKTEVFLVEAALCCPHFQNTVLEVARFMADVGYKLIDITDLNRSPKDNALWLCELAFVRTGSSLLESTTSYE